MEIKNEKLYSVPEVCEILKMERHTVYKLIDDGRIKSLPTKKWEHRLVYGKFLKRYLGL